MWQVLSYKTPAKSTEAPGKENEEICELEKIENKKEIDKIQDNSCLMTKPTVVADDEVDRDKAEDSESLLQKMNELGISKSWRKWPI